jgi:hypothetical protein
MTADRVGIELLVYVTDVEKLRAEYKVDFCQFFFHFPHISQFFLRQTCTRGFHVCATRNRGLNKVSPYISNAINKCNDSKKEILVRSVLKNIEAIKDVQYSKLRWKA